MGTKKGHKKGHSNDHFCDLFYDLFSMFIDGLSTFSSTQLADSNGHFTRVIYHFGELGYNIEGGSSMIVLYFISVS